MIPWVVVAGLFLLMIFALFARCMNSKMPPRMFDGLKKIFS